MPAETAFEETAQEDLEAYVEFREDTGLLVPIVVCSVGMSFAVYFYCIALTFDRVAHIEDDFSRG